MNRQAMLKFGEYSIGLGVGFFGVTVIGGTLIGGPAGVVPGLILGGLIGGTMFATGLAVATIACCMPDDVTSDTNPLRLPRSSNAYRAFGHQSPRRRRTGSFHHAETPSYIIAIEDYKDNPTPFNLSPQSSQEADINNPALQQLDPLEVAMGTRFRAF